MRPYAQSIVGGLLGIGLEVHLASTFPKENIWLPGVFLPAVLLSSVIYQFGHLVAGKIVGYRFMFFTLGPLRFEAKSRRGVRIVFNPEWKTWLGYCLMAPTNTTDLARKRATWVSGGPLASLTFCVVFLVMSYSFRNTFPMIGFCLATFGDMSLIFAIISIWPSSTPIFKSAGAHWLNLRIPGPIADRQAALITLTAYLTQGMPAAGWPDDMLAMALAVEDGTTDEASAHYVAYLRDVDRGALDSAEQHISQGIEIFGKLRPVLAGAYALEKAFLAAWYRHDLVESQSIRATISNKSLGIDNPNLFRLDAVIALREGKFDEARRLLDLIAAEIGDEPRWQWTRSRVAEIRAELNNSSSQHGMVTSNE